MMNKYGYMLASMITSLTVSTALAKSFTIPSGDVSALTNALTVSASPYDRINLEPGVYDLRGIKMNTNNGGSHLNLTYSKLKGLGSKPEDVQLVGDGTLRVLRIDSSWYAADFDLGARIENLTITNGFSNGYDGGGIRMASGVVTNCLIVGCKATGKGGGLFGNGSGRVYSSVICGCMAQHGGGLANMERIYGCDVHDNYCTGWGGGLYYVNSEQCTIRNNFTGNSSDGYGRNSDNAAWCDLSFCEVAGTSVFACNGFGCSVHGVGSQVVLNGNPFVSGEVAKSCVGVWVGGWRDGAGYFNAAATNCLFYSNCSDVGDQNSYLFNGRSKSIVNCTIIDNRKAKTFHYAQDAEDPCVVENCVFARNHYAYNNKQYDLFDNSWSPTCSAGAVLFLNCAYGTANTTPYTNKADIKHPRGEIWQFGVDGFPADPGFSTREGAPLGSLRVGSPLRGRGAVEDWMRNSTDIVGYSRLVDGKVDVGCYQYQPSGRGLCLIVR